MDLPYYSKSELFGDAMMVYFFEVPSFASGALLTMLHPLSENVLQTIDHFEICCFRAPFSWLEKPKNHTGQGLDCMVAVLMRFHQSNFSKPNTESNTGIKIVFH
jgi:hypothetical protein